MLAEVVTAWDTFCYMLHGFYALFVPLAKFLFSAEFLPFTIMGIIGMLVKIRRH